MNQSSILLDLQVLAQSIQDTMEQIRNDDKMTKFHSFLGILISKIDETAIIVACAPLSGNTISTYKKCTQHCCMTLQLMHAFSNSSPEYSLNYYTEQLNCITGQFLSYESSQIQSIE